MFFPQDDIMTSPSVDSDTESLQTDIQRFMAILAFCLMAIFALVQSIPVTAPDDQTVAEDLTRKMQLQEEDIEQLKTENKRLKKEIDLLETFPAVAESLRKELDEARSIILEQKGDLDKLLSEKIEKKADVFEVRDQLDKREAEIRELKQKNERVESLLEQAVRAARDIVKRNEEKKKLDKLREQKKAKREKEPEKEKGVYLAFEDENDIIPMLGEEKIFIYINILAMKNYDRFIVQNGKIDFNPQVPAENLDLWLINEDEMPVEILERYRSWTTLASKEKRFVLGLPPEISRQIRGKMVESGRFLIKPDGTVSFSKLGD